MKDRDNELAAFDDEVLEREWLAQEAARRQDVDGIAPYRLLARILREPPPDSLPMDFAARIAARAAVVSSDRLESALMAVLIVALAIMTTVIAITYADQLPAVNSPAGTWLLAACGCLGGSWLWERGTRRRLVR